jgi:hypothetical protein
MLKRQRCERFSSATLFLTPGSTSCTSSTTRYVGAPQSFGGSNVLAETSP